MSIDYSENNFAFPKQKTTKEKKQYRLKQKSNKLAALERNRFSIITDKRMLHMQKKKCKIRASRGF